VLERGIDDEQGGVVNDQGSGFYGASSESTQEPLSSWENFDERSLSWRRGTSRRPIRRTHAGRRDLEKAVVVVVVAVVNV